jgi:hypothetical protein
MATSASFSLLSSRRKAFIHDVDKTIARRFQAPLVFEIFP